MAIIRVDKRSNYTVVDNTFIRDMNLSMKAKGLMLLMLSLPPEWDYSVAGLSAICKEGMTAIRGALKELEECGYLCRERRNSEKGYFVYEYILSEIPQPHNGNLHTVKEHAADAYAEDTHTENRTQLSKEELNKDLLNKDNLEREKDEEEEIYDILASIKDKELRELYTDYVIQRRENGSPLTPKGLHMLIARGFRLSDNDMAIHRAIVETAIINNWMNLYEPRAEEKIGRNGYLEERKRFYLGDG
jgi:predicted transcriptional regulator